jgi:hypothetical protein
MSNIFRTFMFASIILLGDSARAQLSRFEGIWQNVQNPDEYYSIHINDDKIVFVHLPAIEYSGETLSSAFYGGIVESASGAPRARLHVLDPGAPVSTIIELVPVDETDLNVYSCGPPCTVGLVIRIRKIF